MPELPEVESARVVIERNGLGRCIADVDDSDAYVCRPHAPGEIRHALLGRELTSAMRRGKSMWCPTGPSPEAVTLGIHLGMSGKIVIADSDGAEIDGGDYWEGRARIHPARIASSLTPPEQRRMIRASRDAIRAALRDGGVHTLKIIPYRRSGGTCPRDHAPMNTGPVDGRTSWWCSAEQLLAPGSG